MSGCHRTADGDFIAGLMKPVREPGRFASWIAPPKIGIDNKPGDFEYVRIAPSDDEGSHDRAYDVYLEELAADS